MLIALLAVLGVDLIVIVALLALVVARKLWVRRQPGAFAGAIRAADGELAGLGPTWRSGYGRWVRDVLVWTRSPFLFRNLLLPADGLDGQRPARPGEVKRLGEHPVVIRVRSGGATVEVAAPGDAGALLLGQYRSAVDAPVADDVPALLRPRPVSRPTAASGPDRT